MATGKRKEGETFEEYRYRLKKEHFELNHGYHRMWDSKVLGTLIKKKNV